MAWVENGKVGIESKSKMTTFVNYSTNTKIIAQVAGKLSYQKRYYY